MPDFEQLPIQIFSPVCEVVCRRKTSCYFAKLEKRWKEKKSRENYSLYNSRVPNYPGIWELFVCLLLCRSLSSSQWQAGKVAEEMGEFYC